MRNKSNFDAEEVSRLIETTNTTIQEIGRLMHCRTATIMNFISRTYSPEFLRLRKSKLYRLSKSGEKNPMFGKFREDHHNYKGRVADGKGYMMVLKPEWFTGRPGSKHVFEHTAVMCEHLGLTELPPGMQIHHINKDKTDNDIDNLALVTSSAHQKLHWL